MKNIVQGITNHILVGDTEESKRKISICLTCPEIIDLEDQILGPRCGKCGCVLKWKTKSDSSCPIMKW